MKQEIFRKYNIDYEKSVQRFMNDEEMYFQMLDFFLNDDTFLRTKKAYTEQDFKTLQSCTHELKGVSGNIGLTDLYNASCLLLDNLRTGNFSDVNMMFAKIELAYNQTIEAIKLIIK